MQMTKDITFFGRLTDKTIVRTQFLLIYIIKFDTIFRFSSEREVNLTFSNTSRSLESKQGPGQLPFTLLSGTASGW